MRTTAFPKILHLGHKQIKDIFDGEVEITEKVDGCVTPETGILMSDLSYKKAINTALKNDSDECYELQLEDGRKVRVTHNHPLK